MISHKSLEHTLFQYFSVFGLRFTARNAFDVVIQYTHTESYETQYPTLLTYKMAIFYGSN